MSINILGLYVMSDELEQLGHALLTNSVPEAWSRVGYLSLKNLMPWTNELVERHSFMHKWSVGGTPTKFWMNALSSRKLSSQEPCKISRGRGKLQWIG